MINTYHMHLDIPLMEVCVSWKSHLYFTTQLQTHQAVQDPDSSVD